MHLFVIARESELWLKRLITKNYNNIILHWSSDQDRFIQKMIYHRYKMQYTYTIVLYGKQNVDEPTSCTTNISRFFFIPLLDIFLKLIRIISIFKIFRFILQVTSLYMYFMGICNIIKVSTSAQNLCTWCLHYSVWYRILK